MEMSSDSGAGSYLRLMDLVYHSTLGSRVIALEATQGQMDDFLSQLRYKGHLEAVASVGD